MPQPPNLKMITEATLDAKVVEKLNDPESEVAGALSTTIGAQAIGLIERSPAASKQRITAQGAVTFSWDDGYERCHRVLLPILQNEYPNQRHTFGISSNLINSGAQFMTTAQVQDIYNAGHEIANHGYNHLNAKNATAPQRLNEFDTSQDQLEAMTGERPTTWIYPEGNNGRDAVTDQELYGRFKVVVNAGPSWGGSMVPMSQRNGMFMIARPAEWTSATHQQVLELIRQTANQPVILNLYAHRPGDGPTGGSSGGGTANMTEAEIREALDLVEELGIPAVTIRDAFPGQPVLGNPDAEKGTTGWFPVVSGAGKTFTTETVGVIPGFKGDKAFKLSSTDPAGFIYVVQDIPCAEGQSFTFSGRVRKTNTTTQGTATIRIQAMDQFGASMGSIYSSSMGAADGQWVKCIATHPAAPVGASVMRVSAILNTHVGDLHFKHMYYGRTGLGDFG